MPTTMSKFLMLGLPLYEIVKMSTLNPAKIFKQRSKYWYIKNK